MALHGSFAHTDRHRIDNDNLRKLASTINESCRGKKFRAVGRHYHIAKAITFTKLKGATLNTTNAKKDLDHFGIDTENNYAVVGIGYINELRLEGTGEDIICLVPVDGTNYVEGIDPEIYTKTNFLTKVYSIKSPYFEQKFKPDKNFPTHILRL
jgi:hypothetical protein